MCQETWEECVFEPTRLRVCAIFDASDWRQKALRLGLDKTFHQTFHKIYSHLQA